MITINNLSAWITIGGKTCEEYDVQMSENTRTVTCWIASEEGKEYEVNLKRTGRMGEMSSRVTVDGHPCGGLLLRAVADGEHSPVQITGLRTSPTTLARFTFSSVKTTDNSAFMSTPDSPELGDIKLTVRNSRTTLPNQNSIYLKAPSEKTFHETAKKCGSHQTRFQETAAARVEMLECRDYGEPLAVFCFKYRPLSMLQANEIAPRPQPKSSSPPPPSVNPCVSTRKRCRPLLGSDEEDVKPDVDVLELTDDEDEDDAKLRDLRDQIAAIEAKKKRKGSTSRKKVKLESKREPFVGITIDLTDD